MAVVAEHYGNGDNGEGTAITEQESYREAKKVVELMKLTDEIPVLEGCRGQLPDEKTFVETSILTESLHIVDQNVATVQ